MIKKCISNGVTVLPVTNSNFSWIKLHNSYFNLAKDLYICFLHIPPVNSTYSRKHGDQFEHLSESIVSFANKGSIMICGDINARTATDLDFILSDSETGLSEYDPEYIFDDNILLSRNSQDHTKCSRGEMLLDLCIKSRLRILNGRILGDTQGKFTAYCSLGSSVIDYMLSSEEIMSSFLYMKVHNLQRSLSNHCMLSCAISVNYSEFHCHQNLSPLPKRYIWNANTVHVFQQELSAESYLERRGLFMDTEFTNTSEAVSCFTDILNQAASATLKCRKNAHIGKPKVS